MRTLVKYHPALQTYRGAPKQVSKQVDKGGLADTGYVDFQKTLKGTLIAWLKGRNKVGVNDQFLEVEGGHQCWDWCSSMYLSMIHKRHEWGGEEMY